MSQPSAVRNEIPPPPPQIGKTSEPFCFPKSLLNPFVGPLIRAADRGWFGQPLKRHVVICGFPRSGTTLCQAMIESCVSGVRIFGRERRAATTARYAFRTHPMMVTKRPGDIFCIPKLRKLYSGHPSADVRFVVFYRDPRAVLTSRHSVRPDDYYVSIERWKAINTYWKWAHQSQAVDMMTVRYEDLVQDPQQFEVRLTEFTGWKVERPFADYQANVPSRFNTLALNGLRPVDATNVDRWKADKYRPRISEILRRIPELPQWLIDMNYEADASWTAEYRESARRAA